MSSVRFVAAMAMSVILVTSYVVADENAYDNDINRCLFQHWPKDVLAKPVYCPGSQLCYSVDGNDTAQFAVCYNTKTLTPDFTGHIVPPLSGGKGQGDFRDEAGNFSKH